jgi:hypothetical protein
LALDAAFPDEIAPIPPKQVQLAYIHWEWACCCRFRPNSCIRPSTSWSWYADMLGRGRRVHRRDGHRSMIPQTFEAARRPVVECRSTAAVCSWPSSACSSPLTPRTSSADCG